MDPKVAKAWDQFLNPDVLRPTIIASSMFVMAFEVTKDAIVRRIKSFYTNGFGPGGDRIDPDYTVQVLARNRSPVYASLEWLKESNAITETDIAAFGRAKAFRNRLAHDLMSIVGREGLPADYADRFEELLTLLRKVETWWIINVDLQCDPDAPKDVDAKDVQPGTLLALRMMWEIALGEPESSRKLYEQFRQLLRGGHTG
jgi:hypothetical protein